MCVSVSGCYSSCPYYILECCKSSSYFGLDIDTGPGFQRSWSCLGVCWYRTSLFWLVWVLVLSWFCVLGLSVMSVGIGLVDFFFYLCSY